MPKKLKFPSFFPQAHLPPLIFTKNPSHLFIFIKREIV